MFHYIPGYCHILTAPIFILFGTYFAETREVFAPLFKAVFSAVTEAFLSSALQECDTYGGTTFTNYYWWHDSYVSTLLVAKQILHIFDGREGGWM